MRLSVVIPTRDRPGVLADCLTTLADQVEPPGGMEILVVDDGSDQPLTETVARFADRGLPVRCIRQPRIGLNAGRNRGVREARGELIAFLDDDTLVRPGWATAIDQGFASQGCDVIGGRIVVRLEAARPRWLTEARLSFLSHYDLGPDPCVVRRPPLPFGANFALTRQILGRVDPFRDGLDRIGTSLVSNGETELLGRVLSAGGRIVYWPEAEVAHRVPAERLTKRWFRRRAHAQGVSDVRTKPDAARPYPILLAREVIRAGRALPILILRLIERRGSFDAVLWLIYCRGRVEELSRQHDPVRV